ncbi:MAG: hypothetical protein SV377_01440 [Halobacteria archaeon]|nr:hypothetical protein [Halobacteria archaeon]
MKCPACGERVYSQELIDGDCPLCGASIEDPNEGDTIEKIVGFFESESETMMMNMDQDQTPTQELVLHVPPSFSDRVKPKKCAACGRWHIKFGDKEYQIKLQGNEGEININYYCKLCETTD